MSAHDPWGYVLLTTAALPAGDAWLSAAERARAAGMKVESRRQDFRLGRLTARAALGAWLGLPAPGPEVEIAAAPDGAPEVLVPHAPSISLSHRAGQAVCAIGPPGFALGIDLELVEPRSAELVDQFFTAAEQRLVGEAGAERDLRSNLVWSAKESAAKALREGLRLDTRVLEVQLEPGPAQGRWSRLRVATPAGALRGWWRVEGALVLTAVCGAALGPPGRLA